jgi:hypothetical protein
MDNYRVGDDIEILGHLMRIFRIVSDFNGKRFSLDCGLTNCCKPPNNLQIKGSEKDIKLLKSLLISYKKTQKFDESDYWGQGYM